MCITDSYKAAETGAAANVANAGTFDLDVDSNGRWSVEKFKGLIFQIERDANAIAQRTRRGKGNVIMCSADVASALTMAGVLDYTPALNANLNVDDTGNTFAGVLQGKYRVYIDPYSANTGSAGTGSHEVENANSSVVAVCVCGNGVVALNGAIGKCAIVSEWVSNDTVTGLKADLRLESILSNCTYHLQRNVWAIEQTCVIR